MTLQPYQHRMIVKEIYSKLIAATTSQAEL